MTAYATVDDLEARWRTLTEDEQAKATTLLDDAAVRIDSECPAPGVNVAAETAARLIVSCNMVQRAMTSAGQAGILSFSETQGPFVESVKYANPMGDLYLTRQDRRLLGYRSGAMVSAPLSGEQTGHYRTRYF